MKSGRGAKASTTDISQKKICSKALNPEIILVVIKNYGK